MSLSKYRPDIDGLRAVAVMLVLLYHADLWDVNGGYVGVDVFFVISGYLITSLILKDLKDGAFSLLDFWERRIRRILPALGVVTLCTLVAGWFLFLPQDYAVLGKQAASQAVFSSNILFYTLSGYFASENATKPLLHTWSLAVEEQYYFIVPFLLAFLFAKCRNGMREVLFALMVASFAASVWAVKYYPDAAFYLLPFRAWELLVGSVLAFYNGGQGLAQSRWKAEAAAAGGILAVILPAGLYSASTPFPGAAALAPCIGAALLIHANGGDYKTLVGRILSSRPFVFIGLISYSLYLWHWPLLMFAEYVPLIELHSAHRIGLLIVSAVIAYCSWKYIEQPCRKKHSSALSRNRTLVYGYAFAGLCFFAVAGVAVAQADGIPSRWPASALHYASGKNDRNPHAQCAAVPTEKVLENDGLCQTNPSAGAPEFILWGDSFSDSAMPVFFSLSQKYGKNGYIASRHSCAPILGMRQGNSARSEDCAKFNYAVLDLIKRHNLRHVFLIANWNSWFRIKDSLFDSDAWYGPYKHKFDNMAIAGAQSTIDRLIGIDVKPYVMVGPPTLSFNAPLLLAFEEKMSVREKKSYTPLEKYKKEREKGIERLVAANENGKVVFIDPLPLLCPDTKCISEHEGDALYFDRNHLTAQGAALVEPLFDPIFEKMD